MADSPQEMMKKFPTVPNTTETGRFMDQKKALAKKKFKGVRREKA